jgi:two-component system, NarL family, response regulator DegU
MAREITVVTVEDHHLTRLGIKSQIDGAPGMRVVAEGSAGEDVIGLVKTHRPDVLLLDLDMPQHKDGSSEARFPAMSVIRLLHEQYPETAIIIISMNASNALIEGALTRGVNGYLLKDDALTMSLPKAIQAVVAGGIFFSNSLSRRMYASEEEHGDGTITRRQKEILLQIIEDPDLSYAQIGERLGISEGSVKNRMSELNRRLNVSNRTAAIVQAIKRGLIVIESEVG